MRRVLIFGGTGSLGKSLIRRFVSDPDVTRVIAYSRDEAKHWTIRNELHSQKVQFIVGDIRDKQRVRDAIVSTQADTVIIAAALKQVDTCELSPRESILTNIVGTQNVVDVVAELAGTNLSNVSTVLFVSTDKACSPVNVYGMCKSVSERLVTSMSARFSEPFMAPVNPRFICVRYGNVLESRGSIIPLFKYQAESCPELTVTNPAMTRFVMTLDESVDLITTAIQHAESGQTWIPMLPSMRIGDLADIFAKRFNKKINIIGTRPGEKLHEELINVTESERTQIVHANCKDHYVIHAISANVSYRQHTFQYTSSDKVMTRDELEAHLTKLGILQRSLASFEGRSIEEIRKQ